MIYFDNSATTNPKPHKVIFEAYNSLVNYSYNSGRGGYNSSLSAADKIYTVRERLSSLTGALPQNIVFTQNCTFALNTAIKGLAQKVGHVLISSLEHNAVLRPVYALSKANVITFDVVPFYPDKAQQVKAFEERIRSNTSLIVCTMASNVFGCVMPYREIGALAKRCGISFVVDAAQGLGILDVDIKRDNIDVLCCAGHKGLYGPMALGFMAVGEGVTFAPLAEGGTGSLSSSEEMPDLLPDRFEAGTLSNPLIAGLGAGAEFVMNWGIDKIYNHELTLIRRIYETVSSYDKVILYTPYPKKDECVPILSFNIEGRQSEETAQLLSEKNIAVRGGLHCAPLAHKCFSTLDSGTVRISPSIFTTKKECEFLINCIKKL